MSGDLHLTLDDWRQPYRSRDAGGSPDSATHVGHRWLLDIARVEYGRDPAGLDLDHPVVPGANYAVIYRDRKPIAAYFVVRDPMNFAQLFRWRVTP